MIKKFITVFILLLCTSLFSQKNIKKLKSDLKLVKDLNTAKKFIKTHPNTACKIYTYNEEKHKNNFSKTLFSKNIGENYEIEDQNSHSLYKIISITTKIHYRASYIFLDGNKLPKKNIDSLNSLIKLKLNSGEQFNKLAGKYSMSRNSNIGGDLGWFTQDKMPKDFVDSLKTKEINSVYDFNLKNTNKYYIVKKTETEKEVRLLQVLKISLEKDKKSRLIKIAN
jgi:parvulin-like peptidyl-prolyl isomerase